MVLIHPIPSKDWKILNLPVPNWSNRSLFEIQTSPPPWARAGRSASSIAATLARAERSVLPVPLPGVTRDLAPPFQRWNMMDKYFTNLMTICCSIMFYLGMNLFGEFWYFLGIYEIFFGIHEICLGFMRYVWDLRGIVWGYWVDDGWWGSLHWWIMILIEGYWKWLYCHWMAHSESKPSRLFGWPAWTGRTLGVVAASRVERVPWEKMAPHRA